MGQRTALTGSSAMTHVTKTTKRKNNATGLDISQFPELCLAIDKAVGAGLLKGSEGDKSLTQIVMKRFIEATLQGEMQA